MKYFLSVGSIFKNESHILREWIEHYINEGVEHFYLIDNGSNDNYKNIINDFEDYITLFIDNERYKQSEHYNKYFLPLKNESEWLIIVDLYEFIYSRNGYDTISDYLKTLDDNIGAVSVMWKIFGSGGHIDQPTSVIQNFVHRRVNFLKHIGWQKQIIRTIALKKLDLHDQELLENYYKIITNGNKFIEEYKTNEFIDINNINDHNLHLNHYVVQSYNWFKNIKMIRGDATHEEYNTVRNDNYFKAYDINDVEDMELKLKKYLKK